MLSCTVSKQFFAWRLRLHLDCSSKQAISGSAIRENSSGMSEKTYQRYTFTHDLTRILKDGDCNVRKFFPTMSSTSSESAQWTFYRVFASN